MAIIRSLRDLEREDEDDRELRGIMGVLRHPLVRWQNSKKVAKVKRGIRWTGAKAWQLKSLGGKTLWVVSTLLVITLLPLMMEMEREQGLIEAEESTIEAMIKQGATYQQLVDGGFDIDIEKFRTLNK